MPAKRTREAHKKSQAPMPRRSEDSATTLANTITAKLEETGEKDRLKDMLRARLIECGWRDSMKAHCKGEERRRRRLCLVD